MVFEEQEATFRDICWSTGSLQQMLTFRDGRAYQGEERLKIAWTEHFPKCCCERIGVILGGRPDRLSPTDKRSHATIRTTFIDERLSFHCI